MISIKGHCSYLGHTGYNYHSRNFFRSLYQHFPDLKIRNFTVCKNFNNYLTETDKKILSEQTLFVEGGKRKEFSLEWNNEILDKSPDFAKIHIILNTSNHHYFYDQYNGYKIAYVVWETTEIENNFFNKLKEFDQLWVVSEWHKQNAIKQGYYPSKIHVVPEALDDDLFIEERNNNNFLASNSNFKFLLCGRWEYRKATKEIIETFLKTFDKKENIDLILNIDNQFDNLSTLEKLKKYGVKDNRLQIKSFLNRKEYINYLKNCHVLLSCSRGEGWNRPLHEALALGTPSIFSNYGGQLEYANELPLKVNTQETNIQKNENTVEFYGKWGSPDFAHLSRLMRDAYQNYDKYKKIYFDYSTKIKEKYKSDNIGNITKKILIEIDKNYSKENHKNNNKILFITGGDSDYQPIIEKLVYSLNLFSRHKIVVYAINSNCFETEYSNLIKKNITLKKEKDSDKWYFKQKICLQALIDFPEYSKFIWIDGDSVANDNIDNAEKYFDKLTNYPLCDISHLTDFYFFDINEKGDKYNYKQYNDELIKEFNISRTSNLLGHACFFLFNRECSWFLQEIIDTYQKLKTQKKDHIIICNDEGLDNLLRWKYNFTEFLPQSNFETGFNSEFIPQFFERNGPFDFGHNGGWNFIPENKSNIIYFHGNKKPEIADQIIGLILKNQSHSHSFYLPNNSIIDFKKIPLTGTVIEVAKKYGWFSAMYYETYCLNDYDKIDEIKIKTNDIVIDIGANLGIYSKYAASKEASKIFAFEPDDRFFTTLEKNIRLSDEAFNCALHSYNGECELFMSNHIGGSTIVVPMEEKSMVSCFTLDHFWDSGLWDKIDLLKIDAEGAEFEIFKGINNENLQKIKKITLEYHHCFFNHDENKRNQFIERFNKLGFKTYMLFLGNNDNLQMIYLWQ
ncbi:MAG: FkbM family methyltransferase [Nanoarchaeota archaeon]